MSENIVYRIVAHAELDAAAYAAISAMDQDIFADHPFGLKYEWAPAAYHALATQGERLVGHSDLTERMADVGGVARKVVGLGTVMTARDMRGRGIASAILDRCEPFCFDTLGADFGMLFCSEDIVPFYTRRGWRLVRAPVTVEQPGERFVWPHLAMLLPRVGLPWDDQPIDIRGLPW